MFEKIQVLAIYAFIGLLIALWPIMIRLIPERSGAFFGESKFQQFQSAVAILFVLISTSIPIFVVFSTSTSAPLIALVGLCGLIAVGSAFHRRDFIPINAAYIFAALLLSVTLPWWKRGQLTWLEIFLFSATVLVVIAITRKSIVDQTLSSVKLIQNATFLVVIAVLSFVTTQLHDETLFTTWHHWGAYIGPSELLLAGARLFLDIPAQYGLGPTLIIASACGQNCWEGMYYIVGSSTIIFATLIAYLALSMTNEKISVDCIPRWLVLALCIVCCFLWGGYPAHLSLPLSYPSSGGLRFLPAIAFVTLLIRFDYNFQNKDGQAKWGHFAWCLASLWSPESGFYATCIWWPYYLLLRSSQARNDHELGIHLFKAVITLLMVTLGLVTVFTTIYWVIYHALPSAQTFFAYALNPPGPLTIDPNGTIWFFVAVIVLSVFHNWHTFQCDGNTPLFRRGFVLLLLTYSTFSYFLGRSHDNNILNILPFIFLLLLNIYGTSAKYLARTIAATLLATLIGWSYTINWDSWFESDGRLNTFEFNSRWINNVFKENKDSKGQRKDWPFPDDAIRALSEIHRNTDEPVTVVSSWSGIASTNPEQVWSAFHGPANIVLFPSATRRRFLLNTAITIKRSGWLIIPQSELRGTLVADFDSVYRRSLERDYGAFHAIRFAPR